MKKSTLMLVALAAISSSCQTPAPEAVARSQQPPSAAVKQQFMQMAKQAGFRRNDIVHARISSVVSLDPRSRLFAFCVQGAGQFRSHTSEFIGVSFRDGRILGSTVEDYRCHDQRLRYYPFPELGDLGN